MSDVRAAVLAFIQSYTDRPVSKEDESDLFMRLGIDGDDAFQFAETFAERFEVEMSAYRWYFHHGEEGFNFGSLIIRGPYQRVTRIPVSVETLVDAVETKRWPIAYPPHQLPSRRCDVAIMIAAFAAIPIVVLAVWGLTQFV